MTRNPKTVEGKFYINGRVGLGTIYYEQVYIKKLYLEFLKKKNNHTLK